MWPDFPQTGAGKRMVLLSKQCSSALPAPALVSSSSLQDCSNLATDFQNWHQQRIKGCSWWLHFFYLNFSLTSWSSSGLFLGQQPDWNLICPYFLPRLALSSFCASYPFKIFFYNMFSLFTINRHWNWVSLQSHQCKPLANVDSKYLPIPSFIFLFSEHQSTQYHLLSEKRENLSDGFGLGMNVLDASIRVPRRFIIFYAVN